MVQRGKDNKNLLELLFKDSINLIMALNAILFIAFVTLYAQNPNYISMSNSSSNQVNVTSVYNSSMNQSVLQNNGNELSNKTENYIVQTDMQKVISELIILEIIIAMAAICIGFFHFFEVLIKGFNPMFVALSFVILIIWLLSYTIVTNDLVIQSHSNVLNNIFNNILLTIIIITLVVDFIRLFVVKPIVSKAIGADENWLMGMKNRYEKVTSFSNRLRGRFNNAGYYLITGFWSGYNDYMMSTLDVTFNYDGTFKIVVSSPGDESIYNGNWVFLRDDADFAYYSYCLQNNQWNVFKYSKNSNCLVGILDTDLTKE